MKKMLVVVDYQYDFIKGSLGFPGADKMDTAIAAKIRKYHENGDLVIQTMDSHEDNYLTTQEGRHLPVVHCIYGTPGWETYGETGVAIKEIEESLQFRRMGKATFPMHPYAMVDMLDWIVMNGINLRDEGRLPQARPFVEAHKLMPIPQTALDKNANLRQNDGY